MRFKTLPTDEFIHGCHVILASWPLRVSSELHFSTAPGEAAEVLSSLGAFGCLFPTSHTGGLRAAFSMVLCLEADSLDPVSSPQLALDIRQFDHQ
jgi:hypothetical protein